MNLFNLKKKGFTVIELISVIVVVGILSTVAWVSYINLDKKMRLDRSTSILTQGIREVLDRALLVADSEHFGFNPGPDFMGGYGVYLPLDESYFAVFIDSNNNKLYDSGSDYLINNIFLDNQERVKITEVAFSAGCSSFFRGVVFLPPDPTVYIGGNNQCHYLEVSLKHDDLDEIKKVKINSSGLID
jgi:prepilin-type N-terminal cleavage/methylation domain-containing protein